MTVKRVKIPPDLRERILKRDGYRCTVCDGTETLVVHLITPIWRGGDLSANNLITLCKKHVPKERKGEKEGEKKVQIGASVDPVLRNWLDNMVEEGRFGSRSHGVEESLKGYKEFMETGEIRRILP